MDLGLLRSLCARALQGGHVSSASGVVFNVERHAAEQILQLRFPKFTNASSTPPIQLNPNILRDFEPLLSSAPKSPDESVCECISILGAVESPLYPHSESVFVVVYLVSHLQALVQAHYASIAGGQKLELGFLYQRPTCPHFIVASMTKLYGMLLKVSWFEGEHAIASDMETFKTASLAHWITVHQMMSIAIAELNTPNPIKNVAKYRKVAVLFRDEQLIKLFKSLLESLALLIGDSLPFESADQRRNARVSCLSAILSCLTFDFIGTAVDESSDDATLVQAPGGWRFTVEASENNQLFFDAYIKFQDCRKQVMECAVQLVSIRRTIFSKENLRNEFLTRIINFTSQVISQQVGLEQAECFHEICRLLARLKINYQLGDLMECKDFFPWLRMITDFSVKSFVNWEWSPNSIQYLLLFWSKTVNAIQQSTKNSEEIEKCIAAVMCGLISSRLENPQFEDSLEEPLEDAEALIVLLEMQASIARGVYLKSGGYLLSLFDRNLHEFKLQNIRTLPGSLTTRMTWLLYLTGALVGSRTSMSASDDTDELDGELVCRSLELINICNQRASNFGINELLGEAAIYFLSQFRKSYVGDQAQRASKFYVVLSQKLGLNDISMLLDSLIQNLAFNFKFWANNERIIRRTVELFSEISSGFTSVRLLYKIESAQFILFHHSAQHFSFLSNTSSLRIRLTYYAALCRLLFAEENADIEKDFKRFMSLFEDRIAELSRLIQRGDSTSESERFSLIGLFKDLRGIASAMLTKKAFGLLFGWVYPEKLPVIKSLFSRWISDSSSILSILKFWQEFATNKSQRLNFDISSANGILVFRVTSEIINFYGNQVLSNPISAEKRPEIYKIFRVLFDVFRVSLSGRYVAFGVFRIYGDSALDSAFHTFSRILACIPVQDLLSYPKLSRSYFSLICVIFTDYLEYLPEIRAEIYMIIMESLDKAVVSSDSYIQSEACAAPDNCCSYIFESSSKKAGPVVALLSKYPAVFSTLLSTTLSLLLTEEENQWSISRALLPLILINSSKLEESIGYILIGYTRETVESLKVGIMKIMDGVESNLSHKNRDRFSSNVSQFKRELSQHLNGRRSSDIVDLHSGNNNISMNNGSKSLRTINSTPSLFVNSKNQ